MAIDRTTDLEHLEPRPAAPVMEGEAPTPEPRVVASTFNEGPAAATPDDDWLDLMAVQDQEPLALSMESEVQDEPIASLETAVAHQGPDHTASAVEGPKSEPVAAIEVSDAPESPELKAEPLVGMAVTKELSLGNSTQALALAAMPHYELGGQPGVVVGKAELRFLLAEAEATVRGPEQNTIKLVEAKPTLDWSAASPEVQASHARAEETIRVEKALYQTTKEALEKGTEEPVAYRFAAMVTAGKEVTTEETSELARDLHASHPEEIRKSFEDTVADLDNLVRDFRARLEAQDAGERSRRLVVDPVEMADRNIQSLVQAGYIEPIKATPEVKDAILKVNDYLKEAAPANWALQRDAEPSIAYRLTDTGIAAGRSVRNWNGDTPEAGLVRLPVGETLPPEVSSDSYSVAAMVMENKANAGILKPGEMGAFLRAEMDAIEFDAKSGLIRPAVALGRVEGVLEGAADSAIQQNEAGHTASSAPLTVRDLENLAQRTRALLAALPDFQDSPADPGWLNKNRALNMAAGLDGIAIGNKLIYYDIEEASKGADMTVPDSWSAKKTSTPDLGATLKTVKFWLDEVAESSAAARRELAAMAEGVFGEQGKVVAARLA